jgi:4-amino-4-deoxy-L-arabinose transferase-like glycosyltransferase
MEPEQKKLFYVGLIAAGGALLLMAGIIPNAAMERALRGQASGVLAWGPTLFRSLLALHGVMLVLFGILGVRQRRVFRTAPLSNQNLGVSQERSWRPWVILSILTVLALGLRLWRLNSDLWFDELVTLLEFVRPPLGEIVTSFHSQNQHMLYSVLGYASVRAFGESAWALRLPAMLFGVASLWALFLLGRRVVGTLEALLACALMTVSYHHIWFSQNARGYSGLLFFATLATWLWLEAISRNSWGWWLPYAGVSALGLWTHMSMVFVVAAQALVYLVLLIRSTWLSRSKADRSLEVGSAPKVFLACLLCGSLTLQLYALSLPEFLRTAVREGVATQSEWTNPLWWIREGLRGLQVGWSGGAVVLFGAVMAVAGWLGILWRDGRAAVTMILPGVLGGATMLALGHPLWPRFFFFSMGFALLIAVHGAMTVPRLLLAPVKALRSREGLTTILALALSSLMILASVLMLPRCYALPKQDFTGARDYVEANRQPGEAVVAVGLAGTAYGRYFASHWLVASTLSELEAVRRNHPKIWLVYTIPVQIRALDPQFWRVIEEEFRIVKVFPGTLGGGEVFVCQGRSRKNPASATGADFSQNADHGARTSRKP